MDGTGVANDDVVRDGQSEAGAAAASGAGVVEPGESFEHSPTVGFRLNGCFGGGFRRCGMYECVPPAEIRMASAITTDAARPYAR